MIDSDAARTALEARAAADSAAMLAHEASHAHNAAGAGESARLAALAAIDSHLSAAETFLLLTAEPPLWTKNRIEGARASIASLRSNIKKAAGAIGDNDSVVDCYYSAAQSAHEAERAAYYAGQTLNNPHTGTGEAAHTQAAQMSIAAALDARRAADEARDVRTLQEATACKRRAARAAAYAILSAFETHFLSNVSSLDGNLVDLLISISTALRLNMEKATDPQRITSFEQYVLEASESASEAEDAARGAASFLDAAQPR